MVLSLLELEVGFRPTEVKLTDFLFHLHSFLPLPFHAFTDVRLRKFAEERNDLLDQVRHLKLELEEERSRHKSDRQRGSSSVSLNGPDTDLVDIQSELKSVFIMEFVFFSLLDPCQQEEISFCNIMVFYVFCHLFLLRFC
jgi:hypothetical protein